MIVNMSPCECGGDGWEAAGEVEVGGLVRRGSVVAVHADLDVAIVHGRLAQHHAQVMGDGDGQCVAILEIPMGVTVDVEAWAPLRVALDLSFVLVTGHGALVTPKAVGVPGWLELGRSLLAPTRAILEMALTMVEEDAAETTPRCTVCALGVPGDATAMTKHVAQWHGDLPLSHKILCPLCDKTVANASFHVVERCSKRVGLVHSGPRGARFASVVVRRHGWSNWSEPDSVLLVREFGCTGFFRPAGGVDDGETPEQAALRECVEEAGVSVRIVGLLSERGNPATGDTMWTFAAELVDPSAAVKATPDYESRSAHWFDDLSLRTIEWRFPQRHNRPSDLRLAARGEVSPTGERVLKDDGFWSGKRKAKRREEEED